MKKLAIGAIALGLFLAAPAVMTAQAEPNYAARHNRVVHQHAAQENRAAYHRAAQENRAQYRRAAQRNRAVHDRAVVRQTNRDERRNVRAVNRANRTDYAVYRANVRAQHRYHWNNYSRPSGWYAHRWTYGERLPTSFYSNNYWINDYISFGLMAPPSGLVWVRYGDDALLINRYSGEVVRVEYDVFY